MSETTTISELLPITAPTSGANQLIIVDTEEVGAGVDKEKYLTIAQLVSYLETNLGINIVNDLTPKLGGILDLNDLGVELHTPSTNLSYEGIIRTMTVDVNAEGFGAPLFMAADGHLETADADSVNTMPCVALALETGTGSKKVLLYGTIRNDSWNWTLGAGAVNQVYVSQTTGTLIQLADMTPGKDDVIQPVGYLISADEIMFTPSMFWITHTG